jgi:hypothetical protein
MIRGKRNKDIAIGEDGRSRCDVGANWDDHAGNPRRRLEDRGGLGMLPTTVGGT